MRGATGFLKCYVKLDWYKVEYDATLFYIKIL